MSNIKGSKQSAEHIKNRIEARKRNGTTSMPLLSRYKVSQSLRELWANDNQFRTRMLSHAQFKKGKKISPEHRYNISKSLPKADKHWGWKGGITPINNNIRHSIEYKLWRESVFKRDNYICQICKASGVYVQADHIKSFAHFPELRFAIDNGRTLCVPCHRKTDTFGYKSRKQL